MIINENMMMHRKRITGHMTPLFRHTHAQRLRCVDRPTGIRPDKVEQSLSKGYERPEKPNKIIKHLHCTFNRPVHGLD